MRLLSAFIIMAALCSSGAFGQVSISNFNPDVGNSVVASGPISASFATAYTFIAGGAPGSAITVSPLATGNLATASFYDGITVSGTYVPDCPCTGALAAYLPTLTLMDSFTLTGTPGQVIPWALSLVVTPQFVSASSNVFDNNILQTLSVGGGGVAVFTGYGTQQACFDTSAGGCGGLGIAGPNNTPFTMSFSGLISSGGKLTFSAQTTGSSSFIVGPGVTAVSTAFDLDPTLRLTVPAGVTVVSNSGVFPVTTVPEPGGRALLLAGLVALGAATRAHRRRGDQR